MPEVQRQLLGAVARVVLSGDHGDLISQLERPALWRYGAQDVPPEAVLATPEATSTAVPVPALVMETASAASRQTAASTRGARRQSRDAATVVERHRQSHVRHDREPFGRGVHVGRNSRENRLTPFANDPLTDPTGEAIYSATKFRPSCGERRQRRPRRADGGRWVVRHAPASRAIRARWLVSRRNSRYSSRRTSRQAFDADADQ